MGGGADASEAGASPLAGMKRISLSASLAATAALRSMCRALQKLSV
jgi:hypothetical protein